MKNKDKIIHLTNILNDNIFKVLNDNECYKKELEDTKTKREKEQAEAENKSNVTQQSDTVVNHGSTPTTTKPDGTVTQG